jgi:hypothetical protein
MSKVLESADDGPIKQRIRGRRAISSGELGLRVNMRGHRMAIKHPSTVKELMSILPLMKKEPIRTPKHLNPEEVVKRSQVLERKLSTKTISKLSKKLSGACCQDDIINVEEQVGGNTALGIDEQRSIGASGAEAELMKKCCDALVPRTRRLLEPIK